MPQAPHIERHFTASETVRDVVIGMSDDLPVPFGLAAGLSGAVDSTALIITTGLAEVAAGTIAMCSGPYPGSVHPGQIGRLRVGVTVTTTASVPW